MKIAVTGSSGFIGSNLVKKLEKLGFQVIKIDISNGIDLLNWNEVKNINNFAILFHLAAKTYVPDSYSIPRDFYSTNIISTLNALELCRLNNAKIIFISSYVYGKPQYFPIDESHPLNGFNPYAHSKIICEQLCEAYHKDFYQKIIIIRPFNIYGIGQNNKFLISKIVKQALQGKIILNDPKPRRDFIFKDDFIDALISTINFNPSNFEIFNIGSGKSYSIGEIANILKLKLKRNIDVFYTGEKRKNEILNTVADISKAQRLLNWNPKTNIHQGIDKILYNL